MAADHEEECFPPAEFILSTIQNENWNHRRHPQDDQSKELDEDKNIGEFGALKIVPCLSCLRYVNNIFCARCVIEKGSLLEKHRFISDLRKQRSILFDAYCQRWKSFIEQQSINSDSKMELEYKLSRLSAVIGLKRDAVNRHLERLNRLRQERQERLKIVNKLRSSVEFMRKKSSISISDLVPVLGSQRHEVASIRQRLVLDLLNHVFPLDAVSTGTATATASGCSSLTMDDFDGITVQDVLTDATLTTFHNDRWIVMGNPSDIQYRLVHSCLIPDHGDYSLLKGWLFNEIGATATGGNALGTDVVAYNAPTMAASDIVTTNRRALGNLSALAYCAQFVNATGRILDVRLPFVLNFSDFFLEKLNESELDTAIIKLNANVAYLCTSQRMDYDRVCFERPFWSLCNLSKNITELGYQSYFTVDARVARGFANAERQITWMERAPIVLIEQTDDWENVNEQIPEWTGAASSPPTLTQLWTSATTSVANLFKMHN